MALSRRPEPRPTLRDLAADIPSHTLSVVVGPAGSGKTTLLESWRDHLQKAGRVVAWLDLSPSHADASSFVGDLRDAVAEGVTGFGRETERSLAHLPGGEDDWRLLARAFRRDWSRVGADPDAVGSLCCLVDNFHTVAASSSADRFLSELLRSPMPGLHFVLSSRGSLPTGASRLRSADDLLEIRADDLFLRFEQAGDLLRERVPDLDDAVVTRLLAQTEGWVTGLLLAGRALARLPKEEHARFAEELSSHPDLFEYIADEVLQGEPTELVQVVECAALLGRCSVRDLREVCGDPAAADWIELSVDHGILQAEGTEVWPHRLWQDWLRARLRDRAEPGEWRALHGRVAAVHRQAGRHESALQAFAEAQDWRGLGQHLVAVGEDWLARGRRARVVEWIGRFPEGFVNGEPALLVLRAQSLMRANPERAEQLLKAACEAYAKRGESDREQDALGGRIALLFLQGRYDEVRPLVRRVLRTSRLLTRGADRGLALTALAGLAFMTRRFDLSLRLSDRALRHPLDPLAVWVLALNRSILRAMRGEFEAALDIVDSALAREDVARQAYGYYTLRVQRGGLRAVLGDAVAGRAEAEAAFEALAEYQLKFQRDTGLRALAVTRWLSGDPDAAMQAARERVALHTGEDPASEAAARARLAVHCWLAGDRARARAAAERSIELFEEVFPKQRHAWPWDFTTALCVAAHAGDAERAWKIAQRHERRLSQADAALTQHILMLQLHAIAHLAGDEKRAGEFARQAWEVASAADLRFSDPVWGPELTSLGGAAALRAGVAVDFVFGRMLSLAPSALPGLLSSMLEDRAVATRIRAAELMARLGGRDLHGPLQAATKDKSAKVMLAAKQALTELDLRPSFKLSVVTLGEFSVLRGDSRISDAEWKGAMPRRLFFRLLAAEGRPVPRDTLVADLWPEADDESARNNLRVALSRLHDALDPGRPSGSPGHFVEAQGEVLSLRLEALAFWDLLAFREAEGAARQTDRSGESDVAISRYLEALALYRGEFLPETRFDEWAIAIRTRLAEASRVVAERLAELLLAADRHAEVLDVAARLIAEDAADEKGWALRMRAHLAAADRTAALRAFSEAEQALRSVLDLEPSAELRRLAALARAVEVA